MKTRGLWACLGALTFAFGCSRGGGSGAAVVFVAPTPQAEFVATQSSDSFFLADGELIQSRLGVRVGKGFIPGATGIQLTPENDCLYIFVDGEETPSHKLIDSGEFLDVEEGEYKANPNAKLTELVWRELISVCRLKVVDDSAMLAIGDFYGAGQEYFEPVGELRVVFLEDDHFNVYGTVRTVADSTIDATYHFCIRLEPYEGKYHIIEEDALHMVNVDDSRDSAILNSHGLDISNGYLLGWFNYRHQFEGETLGQAEEHIATTGFYAQIKCD